MSPPKLTPMLKQYLSIKEAYPDTILFYRMGDFYEMFFEDAQVASRVLDITLTSRNKKEESPVPMCGVPHRAVSGYIARMIDHGYKVAVCDQIEDPAVAKGLVKRDVVRVITPGMIIDDTFLDERSHNFVLAIARHGDDFGLSYLDISTGLFRLVESADQTAIVDESLRISAREILLSESAKTDAQMASIRGAQTERAITYLEDSVFDHKRCYNRLTEQFNTISLEGFGCEGLLAGVRAAGALIFYVRETQKQKIAHLTHLETYSLGHYLLVDDSSCRNLELEKNLHTHTRRGTLMGIVDHTRTAMGARLLKSWLRYPLIEMEDIRARHEAVAEAKDNIQSRQGIREHLKTVFDIERVSTKIVMGHANARDLIALKRSLSALPPIQNSVSTLTAELFRWDENLKPLHDLSALIEKSIREDAPPTTTEGGMIKPGYNDALDELVKISQDGKAWLANLEVKERETTGITTLKVRYNKVFGYYIEVPKSRASEVPANYIRKHAPEVEEVPIAPVIVFTSLGTQELEIGKSSVPVVHFKKLKGFMRQQWSKKNQPALPAADYAALRRAFDDWRAGALSARADAAKARASSGEASPWIAPPSLRRAASGEPASITRKLFSSPISPRRRSCGDRRRSWRISSVTAGCPVSMRSMLSLPSSDFLILCDDTVAGR